MPRENHIARFTEEELRAGLSLLYTPDVARRVASEVYAIPAVDAVFFDWMEPALFLMACAAPELEARVREMAGATAQGQAFMQRFTAFRTWVSGRSDDPSSGLTRDDVVHDVRRDV